MGAKRNAERMPFRHRVLGHAMVLGMAAGCAAVCASKNIPPAWGRLKGKASSAKSSAMEGGRRAWEKFKLGAETSCSNFGARAKIMSNESRSGYRLPLLRKMMFLGGSEAVIQEVAEYCEMHGTRGNARLLYDASLLYSMLDNRTMAGKCWDRYASSPEAQMFTMMRAN